MSNPRQETLTFEPEYAVSGGIKHEWAGTLFLPTAEESERLEKERQTTFNPYSHPDNPALTLFSIKDMVNGLDYPLIETAETTETVTPAGGVTYKFTYVVYPEMAKQLLEAAEWPKGLEDY